MMKIGGIDVKDLRVGVGGSAVTPSRVMVGTGTTAVKVWPSDPQSVTLTTDRNGWFAPGPSGGLIAGYNEYDGIQFTVNVIASHRMVEMVDGTNDRTYEVGDVLPASAFGWYVAPGYAFPVTVTFTEHIPRYVAPLGVSEVGMAGPYSWETASQADFSAWTSQMSALGMKHIRVSAIWPEIESVRNTYVWTQIDMLVNTAVAAGLEPMVLILGYPDWAINFETSGSTYMADWTDFCAALATRYAGSVKTYEVWNEPNLDRFWAAGNPDTYAPFFTAAANALRAADPAAKVITAGLAPATTVAGTSREPVEFLARLYELGAAQASDAIGMHPYGFPESPSGGSSWNTWTKLSQVKSLMAAHGHSNRKIWLTEFGAPTGSANAVTEAQQAAFIVEAISLAADDPMLGPLFIYTLRDLDLGATDMESWFGMYSITGVAKPAVSALQAEIALREP